MTDHFSRPDDSAATPAPTELQQLEAALQAKVISPELFATLAAQLRPTPTPTPVASPIGSELAELPSLLSLFESPPAVSAPLPAPSTPLPAPSAPLSPPVATTPVGALPPPQRPAANPLPPAPTAPPAAAGQVLAPPSAPLARPAAAAPVYVPPLPKPLPKPFLEAGPEPTAPPQRNALTTILAMLGGVGLLGVGVYLYVDQSHPSENLTGPQPAPTEATAPDPTPEPAMAVVAVPETVRVAPLSVPATDSSRVAATPTETASDETPATDVPADPDPQEPTDAATLENSSAAATAATAATAGADPVPAAPEPGDDDATQKIRAVLADYYADLFAPPLAAENYFAPQVERLYIQQNITPVQINATITQTFFPDNKKAMYQVEPGTLRVSTPAQDGSRTATYREACRLFRVSRGRYQRLRTQVRVKFDADYRITFLRQEKMLENVFE